MELVVTSEGTRAPAPRVPPPFGTRPRVPSPLLHNEQEIKAYARRALRSGRSLRTAPPVLRGQQKLQTPPGSSVLKRPRKELSPALSSAPSAQPAQVKRGAASRVGTVTSATAFPAALGRANRPPSQKASQGFIAGGTSDGEEAQPSSSCSLEERNSGIWQAATAQTEETLC